LAAARSRCAPGEPCRVRRLGQTDYASTWRAMQAFTDARAPETPDEIWLTEHPPIYTLGLAGRREHLHRDNGIPVLKVDRGGQITYHGPGQLIAYLLIDIGRRRLGVRQLVRAIEDSVIQLLDSYGVAATVRGGAPGVYVQRRDSEAKIAALGLKIRNGRSYHGMALNIDMDLAPFADIDPCGYRGLAVTRLRDLGIDAPRAEIESRLVAALDAAIGAASDR
jgi:lipoyl(octanoyl) transferase